MLCYEKESKKENVIILLHWILLFRAMNSIVFKDTLILFFFKRIKHKKTPLLINSKNMERCPCTLKCEAILPE